MAKVMNPQRRFRLVLSGSTGVILEGGATPRTSYRRPRLGLPGENSQLTPSLEVRRDTASAFHTGQQTMRPTLERLPKPYSPSSEGTGQASGDLRCPDLGTPGESRLDTGRRVIRLAERRKLNQGSSMCFPEELKSES